MVFSQIQRIYKYQTHYSCRVGLSWSNQKIKPKIKVGRDFNWKGEKVNVSFIIQL